MTTLTPGREKEKGSLRCEGQLATTVTLLSRPGRGGAGEVSGAAQVGGARTESQGCAQLAGTEVAPSQPGEGQGDTLCNVKGVFPPTRLRFSV